MFEVDNTTGDIGYGAKEVVFDKQK